jgi:glucose-1-phosphate adenylyltransferase
VVDTAIIDKFVHVGAGAVVGSGEDRDVANVDEPERLFTGITVVGERARIPPGVRIGRNCLVGPRTGPEDFADVVVASGTSVRRRGEAADPERAARG